MDNFDEHFERTRKMAMAGFIVSSVVGLAVVAVLIWAVIEVVQYITA